MRIVCGDYESFFSNEFTLSRLSTEEYIRSPQFEIHGIAVKWSASHEARWYTRKEWEFVSKQEDWSDVFMIHHHANFDGLISSHHYGVHPKMYGDTLSMARLLLGNHISVSLDSVRKEFGIPPKTTPYNLFRGKHWHELTPNEQQQVAEGACDEVESIWKIFGLLAQTFPAEEYEVVSSTVKMFTAPVLRADVNLLARIWEKEAKDKAARLETLEIDVASLQSAEQFASLLRAEGVEPAKKPGKPNADGSEKLIYAFAKTDPFMEELLDHEDERVKALAEARLGAKSSLVQTRAETLGWMASRGGTLPVYLHYCGAHTTRWSGGDGTNFQNFKKEDPEYPTGGLNLRDALLPPEGFFIAKADLSQQECRLLNYISGQDDVIERFKNGDDPYINVASQFYGYAVNKKDHPNERQCGKIIELQAGFGSGGAKIASTIRIRSRGKILLTEEEGVRARDAYRDTHPCNVDFWKQSERLIARLAGGPPVDWRLGCGRLSLHVRDGRIYLPNGCPMIYVIEYYRDPDNGDSYWRRKTRRGWVKIYGALAVENLIQSLGRVLISQSLIRISRLKYKIVGTEHDSLWILVPRDGHEAQHVQCIKDEMTRPVEWLPGLPLACECEIPT